MPPRDEVHMAIWWERRQEILGERQAVEDGGRGKDKTLLTSKLGFQKERRGRSWRKRRGKGWRREGGRREKKTPNKEKGI